MGIYASEVISYEADRIYKEVGKDLYVTAKDRPKPRGCFYTVSSIVDDLNSDKKIAVFDSNNKLVCKNFWVKMGVKYNT